MCIFFQFYDGYAKCSVTVCPPRNTILAAQLATTYRPHRDLRPQRLKGVSPVPSSSLPLTVLQFLPLYPVLESSRTSPRRRGSSRTTLKCLALALRVESLALAMWLVSLTPSLPLPSCFPSKSYPEKIAGEFIYVGI